MEKLRVGVIGVGNMGTFHAHSLNDGKIEGARLACLCDTSENARARLRGEFPDIKIYPDYKEMLKDAALDAVVIAVPHYAHCEIAIAAFERGLHVLCEKPETVALSKAKLMNKAAQKSGKVFSMMFNQRTDPIFKKARELVRGGVLGKKKRLTWIITNWYRTQAYYDSGVWRSTWKGEGGGVLLNQAPHNLDLWQWIFGMPDALVADCEVGKYHNIEVEDDVRILARYYGGATAEFITSTGEFPGTNRLEMIGDMAKIVIEEGKLKLWRLETPERRFCFECSEGFAQIPMTYEEYAPSDSPEGHIEIMKNFVGAILKGECLIAPGIEGVNELTLSNAAYLSAWQNKTVTLPFDENEFDALLEEKIKTSVADRRQSTLGTYEDASSRWKVRW